VLVMGIAALLPSPRLPAQEDELRQLLTAHLESCGGKERLAEISSIYSKATITVESSNSQGTVEQWQTWNGFYLEIQLPEMTIRQGFDGTTLWEAGPPTGDRMIQNKERVGVLESNAYLFPALAWHGKLDKDSRWKYDGEIKWSGWRDQDGTKIAVVAFAPTGGNVVERIFDATTHRLLQADSELESELIGEPLAARTTFSDFRKVDGVELPYVSTTHISGQQAFSIQVTEIRFNDRVDESKFKPPPSLR
jgi:hypothetical protein